MFWVVLTALVSVLVFKTDLFSEKVKEPTGQDSFNIKLKCAEYGKGIEQDFSTYSWTSYNIEENFYSPIKNSCFTSVFAEQSDRANPYTAFMIWDSLTKEMLFYRDTSLTNNQDISAIHLNAIKYLKGEESLRYSEKDWNLSND